MTFWEHFIRLLPSRPLAALAALYWHVTRRRVRARNHLRVASAGRPFTYAMWIKHKEKNQELASSFEQTIGEWVWRPRFSVIVHAEVEQATQAFERSVRSVECQLYSALSVVDGRNRSLADAIRAGTADYVVALRAGDELSEVALFQLGDALQKERRAAILYGDQDEIDADGRRRRPWFKPGWNEEMFLAQNYLCGAIAIEAALARAASESANNFSDFLLAATDLAAGRVVHVPHILCHAAPCVTTEDWLNAVRERLQGKGANCVRGPFATVKVEWPLPVELPQVSIIVPTRDKLELLRPCIDSVLQRTSYDNFDVLIVDNGSAEHRTLEFLNDVRRNPRVRVISYPGRYNFSAINNFAANHATGAYLCLLNNDTEVVTSDWLLEMMRYAIRPDIGAVGAKLLYEDQTIQHAGVVIGIGDAAGHAHRFLPAGQPGYFRQPHVNQFVSAVTAACLAINKSKYFSVGGLDEADLAVAFNDVDLCLKLRAAGLRNVYVPHAVLFHHESKSRGSDMSRHNIARYRSELEVLQKRWGTRNYKDPHFNPNLDPATETFVVRL